MADNQKSTDLIQLSKGDALLISDIQNDFLSGGSLAVPEGNRVIPVLNGYIDKFSKRRLPVFVTRDWHPSGHCSFVQQGGPWPEHCVAGSEGAEFPADLHLPVSAYIIAKGTDVEKEGYSSFSNRTFKAQLDNIDIRRLFIGGLATDYCVLNTVLDALGFGYQVLLLTDAIRAVNVRPRDGENAIDEMIEKGAIPITLATIE